MSYLPPVVCGRAHVLFTSSCLQECSCLIYLQLFVRGLMSYLPPVVRRRAHVLFTSRCLQEGSCLIYLQLFVGVLMSYLPPVVCIRAHVLFTSSCLQEGACLIYLQLFVGGRMLYLRYLCFIAQSSVQYILCCCFDFLRLVYHVLPISLDCLFFIAPSVFSNVYLQFLWIVYFLWPLRYSLTFINSFSGLSIFDCPFGIL